MCQPRMSCGEKQGLMSAPVGGPTWGGGCSLLPHAYPEDWQPSCPRRHTGPCHSVSCRPICQSSQLKVCIAPRPESRRRRKGGNGELATYLGALRDLEREEGHTHPCLLAVSGQRRPNPCSAITHVARLGHALGAGVSGVLALLALPADSPQSAHSHHPALPSDLACSVPWTPLKFAELRPSSPLGTSGSPGSQWLLGGQQPPPRAPPQPPCCGKCLEPRATPCHNALP